MSSSASIPPSNANGPAKGAAMDERSKARLQKAAREFESLFVGYMLKSMRSSMSTEEMFGDSFGGDMMEGMFDTELARQMSRTSNLGIGEILYRKLTGEQLPRGGPHGAAPPAPGVPARNVSPLPPGDAAPLPGAVSPLPGTAAPLPAEPAAPPPAPAPKPAAAPAPTPLRVQPPAREAVPEHTRVDGRIDQRLLPYEPMITEAAEQHNVSSSLLKAVIASESAGNPRAHSPANAKGLMQLIDTTAADMGVRNVWDPKQNILGGAKYLRQLLERFDGNLEQALASYNAGPGAVEKHGGIPPFAETRAYVSKVLSYLHYFEDKEGGNGNE